MAVEVLTAADPHEKTRLPRAHAAACRAARGEGAPIEVGTARPSGAPARPELLSLRDVPLRKPGSLDGHIALFHAVAPIVLNAVDLHWDMIVHLAHAALPMGIFDDWLAATTSTRSPWSMIFCAVIFAGFPNRRSTRRNTPTPGCRRISTGRRSRHRAGFCRRNERLARQVAGMTPAS